MNYHFTHEVETSFLAFQAELICCGREQKEFSQEYEQTFSSQFMEMQFLPALLLLYIR